jgi:hypothetical protein
MKKTSVFLAVLCVIAISSTSCVEKSKKYQALVAERDSLQMVNQMVTSEFDSTISTINEIENALQSVRESEGVIVVENLEGDDAQNRAVSEIMAMQQTLQQNRQKIADLEKKLASKGSANSALNATIKRLKEEMDEKDAYINNLKDELQKQNIKIEEFNVLVTNLNENIDNLANIKASQEATIKEQDAAMNSVWYYVAPMANLKENGLVSKGGLFKGKEVLQQGFSKEIFNQADKRELKSIALNSKKANILTNHPENSYELIKGEDGMLTLQINDADSFWNISDYLVISIK